MKKILKIKNKILYILISIIFISAIITKTQAYSSLSSYKPKYGTLTANVNFRNISSTSGYVVKVLKKGTAVKMVADLDSFYIVQLGTNEVGTVSKDYIKSSSTPPSGASTYTAISVKNISTNASNVILRRGAGTNFGSITKLAKGTSLKGVGYVQDWYVVVANDGKVGCIRKDLLTFGSTAPSTSNTTSPTFTLSKNEQTILTLINNARSEKGIPKLSTDSTLFKVARLKATDMVKNSYFSHSSPTYGSPFKMMQTYGISYKVAGENIAGNPSLEAAVNAWLNSETHRQNILSTSYNYIGIGVEPSETYGFIISVMFIRQIII